MVTNRERWYLASVSLINLIQANKVQDPQLRREYLREAEEPAEQLLALCPYKDINDVGCGGEMIVCEVEDKEAEDATGEADAS